MGELSGINVIFTFHVSLSFEDDEGVTPAATIPVTNNSYTFDRPETLEFTPEIALGRVFRLEQDFVGMDFKKGRSNDKPDER